MADDTTAGFAAEADRFAEDLHSGVPIDEALEAANAVVHHPTVIECGTRMLGETGTIDMKRLAADAGVSRASLYRYYPDKSKLEGEVARIAVEGMLAAASGEEGVAAKFRAAANYLVDHPGEAAAVYPFGAMVSVEVIGAVVEQVTGDDAATPQLVGISVMAATPGRRPGDAAALRRYIDQCAATLG